MWRTTRAWCRAIPTREQDRPRALVVEARTRANKLGYDRIGAYSSVSEDGKELRVIVINRDMSRPATVELGKLAADPRQLSGAQYSWRELRSMSGLGITDKNMKWSEAVYAKPLPNGVRSRVIQPASVNLFVLPLV
jgi:hypothetical protein